jgi:hypothetical protein
MASMAGLFYFMSLYFYVKGRTGEGLKKKGIFFALCGLCGLASLASKQNAAMLPVSLFLYDLLLIQGVTRESLRRNVKILLLPVLAIVLIALAYGDLSYITDGYKDRPFTPVQRLLTEPRVIIYYIALLLYPLDSRLMLLHDIEISRSLVTPWTTLPAILLIVLIMGAALFLSRKRPLISFCILFFFLNHLIEGSLVPLELIFEHRNYIPSLSFFLLLSLFLVHVLDYFSYRKPLQLMTAALIVFVLVGNGHTTWLRNDAFRTQFALWKDNIAKAPGLSRPHANLGKIGRAHV